MRPTVRIPLCIPAVLLAATLAVRAEDPPDFDESIDYHIVIQVHEYEVETIMAVNVIGMETIGGKAFLVIRGTSFGAKKVGYVLLDTVKAILPVGVVREQRPLLERPKKYAP